MVYIFSTATFVYEVLIRGLVVLLKHLVYVHGFNVRFPPVLDRLI